MGYLVGEASHHVILNEIHVCRIENNDYMKFPQEGEQE
jgi:hypothetical protein